MKVAVSGYVGKKMTGIGRNLVSLLSHAGETNQYVIYANHDIADAFHIDKPNVTVRNYGVSKENSLGNLLWTTFVFPIKVVQECADVALIPNFTLLLFKFRPTLVIMHDLIEFNVPNKFSKLKMFYRTRIADPITARRSDRIVTVSENSKKDIMRFLGVSDSKIDVVYNGVDREVFHKMPESRAKEIIEARGWPQQFILFAGTIDHPGKNPYTVIKAFELLCKDGYKGSLILAGMPGNGYEVVRQAVEESPVWNRIVLTGYVEDDELVALYSQCDTFCFPSLYEGFGIPPLEAIACGANVVVSDTSSLPEVVGDCGKIVNPNNTKEMALAVQGFLEKKYSSEARESHLAKFNWSDLAAKFEAALARVSH